MTIEISRDERAQAITSIERYFSDELDQHIGNIAAGALLNFFLEDIGPLVYNKAVRQVQERLLARVQELDIEFNEDPFQYRRRRQAGSKGRRSDRCRERRRRTPLECGHGAPLPPHPRQRHTAAATALATPITAIAGQPHCASASEPISAPLAMPMNMPVNSSALSRLRAEGSSP